MSTFQTVCSVNDLIKNSGVAVLVNEQQIALFYIDGKVYAVGNYDPKGEAHVISRGMTASMGNRLVVASPLYKDHYDLITGQCVEDETVSIPVYESKIEQDQVLLNVA